MEKPWKGEHAGCKALQKRELADDGSVTPQKGIESCMATEEFLAAGTSDVRTAYKPTERLPNHGARPHV